MSKEAEIKKSLLEQLAAMMMSEDGKRLGPKKEDVLVVVEPVADETAEEDELDETLEDAEKDAMLEHLAAEEVAEEEDDEDNPKRRKTLKEFLASC